MSYVTTEHPREKGLEVRSKAIDVEVAAQGEALQQQDKSFLQKGHIK